MTLSGYAYTCSAGETFDSVARVVYGDENYAPELLCANPEHALKMAFDGSEVLYLPSITMPDEDDEDTEKAAAKAPWRE